MPDRLKAWELSVRRLLDQSYPELAVPQETAPDPLADMERQRVLADRRWATETAEELRQWSERLAAAERELTERGERLDTLGRELDTLGGRLRDRERVSVLLAFGLLLALAAVFLVGCLR
jgi:hypothetical protein